SDTLPRPRLTETSGQCTIGRSSPTGGEEFAEQCRAFLVTDAADHVDTMIRPTVADDVPHAAGRSALVVPRTEHERVDPRRKGGARAHEARFERDGECASGQPPITVLGGG